ncbi:hypothetical protein L7F22_008401 [Adiantum nelumboides]|nr:hypothetical protein [Adiantum nelumboides]MCO5554865.1 hypothetical protein [Adiantum nelumboides]
MEVAKLQQKFVDLTNALFQDGFLDDQFTQLQMLQDASNPDFVSEVITLFFEDSERLLAELSKALEQEPVDYKKVDAYVHQFKGSSSSVGAQRVKSVCIDFRTYAEARNREGCLQALQHIKQEFHLIQNKLASLLKLEQQIIAAGGTVPMMD